MIEDQKELERITISNEFKQTPILIFLYTSFQHTLEIVVDLVYSDDYKKKDRASNILKAILESKFIQQFKTINPIIYNVIGGLLNFYRGQAIYTSEDQLNCEIEFSESLSYFNKLPNRIKFKYLNYIQEIYNSLGIILHNKGQIKKGLQYLGSAEKIYNDFIEVINNPDEIINYTFDKYLVDDYRKDNENHTFHFFIDGGISKKHLERNYTLTIFYIAQAYQRLNFKNKAASYCSQTLKRQIDLNEFDLKDAVVNCINLADFYVENMHFAQTEYILLSALALLPDDNNIKKRLRASVQMQLGRYFVERLKFSLLQIKKDWYLVKDIELNSKVNKKFFVFNRLNIEWPIITDTKDYEDAKTLFRLSNTQLKKALEYFVLEGFVTEHITINREISSLYKHLAFFENDNLRVISMLERRSSILEPIIKSINEKVYVMQWQEIILELSEIYSELFDKKIDLFYSTKKQKQGLIKEANSYGEKSANYYQLLINYLDNEFKKEGEKSLDDVNTIITVKLSLSRLLTKLMLPDKNKRVESLCKGLRIYEEVLKFMKSKEVEKFRDSITEQIRICEEMLYLLPVKISKVQNGEEI